MILNIFFRNCKFVLAVNLLYLFNLALSLILFYFLKSSFVKPILNAGYVTSIINYHPNCILINSIKNVWINYIKKD